MRIRTGIAAILGIGALLVAGFACGDSSSTGTGSVSPAAFQGSGPGPGIWVTGQATITVEPDLALLTIGVETRAETVADARAEAADAMEAIVEAVNEHGLEEEDVQTQSFNIWPEYVYPEIGSGEIRSRQPVLVGYTVRNTAAIKIRDIDSVGTIIDDVAGAGGNVTLIEGISFSIEDPEPFMTQLREEAVADATEKAEHLASLSDVSIGDLTFISEAGGGAPIARSFSDDAFAFAESAPAAITPISGGELQLGLSVQAVFEIR